MHRYIRMRDMPKEILRTMGIRLKMLREEAQVDQRQFARAVSQRGVSVTNSFVSKLESGDSKPSIDVLVALADELGVSADYLLMRTNIPDTADAMLADIERRQQPVDTGVGVSEEAERTAELVDGIRNPQYRRGIVRVVQALVDLLSEQKSTQAAGDLDADKVRFSQMLGESSADNQNTQQPKRKRGVSGR